VCRWGKAVLGARPVAVCTYLPPELLALVTTMKLCDLLCMASSTGTAHAELHQYINNCMAALENCNSVNTSIHHCHHGIDTFESTLSSSCVQHGPRQ
jgi:hypothetical protein